jgi:xylulokinase
MFLSPVFCRTLASVADVSIELYNTDGAQGAARAAAAGAYLVPSVKGAFKGLQRIKTVDPEKNSDDYAEAYRLWLEPLTMVLSSAR